MRQKRYLFLADTHNFIQAKQIATQLLMADFTAIDMTKDTNQNRYLGQELGDLLLFFNQTTRLNALLAITGCVRGGASILFTYNHKQLNQHFLYDVWLKHLKTMQSSVGDLWNRIDLAAKTRNIKNNKIFFIKKQQKQHLIMAKKLINKPCHMQLNKFLDYQPRFIQPAIDLLPLAPFLIKNFIKSPLINCKTDSKLSLSVIVSPKTEAVSHGTLIKNNRQKFSFCRLPTQENDSALSQARSLLFNNQLKIVHLTGLRGTGKSTLLGQFIQQTAANTLLISPSRAASKNTFAMLKKPWRENFAYVDAYAALPDTLFTSIQVLILDEVASLKHALVKQALCWVKQKPERRLILATTLEGYEGNGQSYRLHYLADDLPINLATTAVESPTKVDFLTLTHSFYQPEVDQVSQSSPQQIVSYPQKNRNINTGLDILFQYVLNKGVYNNYPIENKHIYFNFVLKNNTKKLENHKKKQRNSQKINSKDTNNPQSYPQAIHYFYQNVQPRISVIYLKQPKRFAADDALHQFSLSLCYGEDLLADNAKTVITAHKKVLQKQPCVSREMHTSDFVYQFFSSAELRANGLIFKLFQLLRDAHYKTTPNDLQRFYDDEALWILVFYAGELIAALQAIHEKLPETLTLEGIYQGRRRMKNAFTQQALLFSYGLFLKEKTNLNWQKSHVFRISRIATQKRFRRRGIARQMIAYLQAQLKNKSYEISWLSTSFSATKTNIAFWQSVNFSAVRLGSQRNKHHDAFNLLMLAATDTKTAAWLDEFSAIFNTYCVYYQKVIDKDPALSLLRYKKNLCSVPDITALKRYSENVVLAHADMHYLLPFLWRRSCEDPSFAKVFAAYFPDDTNRTMPIMPLNRVLQDYFGL